MSKIVGSVFFGQLEAPVGNSNCFEQITIAVADLNDLYEKKE